MLHLPRKPRVEVAIIQYAYSNAAYPVMNQFRKLEHTSRTCFRLDFSIFQCDPDAHLWPSGRAFTSLSNSNNTYDMNMNSAFTIDTIRTNRTCEYE